MNSKFRSLPQRFSRLRASPPSPLGSNPPFSSHPHTASYLSPCSEITTTAPPTTPIASTLPMTTFGATTTAPITKPGITPATDCGEGQQDCGGETEAPYDYDIATGKPPKLLLLCSHPPLFFIFFKTKLQSVSQAKQCRVKMQNEKNGCRKKGIKQIFALE